MWDAERERQRRLLYEAFVAGWQAGLAVRITSPAARAVVESCFEMWLQEEVDENPVLGLPFRRRFDLPPPGSIPRQRRPRRDAPDTSRGSSGGSSGGASPAPRGTSPGPRGAPAAGE